MKGETHKIKSLPHLQCQNKDMSKQEKCKCEKPILQENTKQCGRCKLYIDRVKHIILTN